MLSSVRRTSTVGAYYTTAAVTCLVVDKHVTNASPPQSSTYCTGMVASRKEAERRATISLIKVIRRVVAKKQPEKIYMKNTCGGMRAPADGTWRVHRLFDPCCTTFLLHSSKGPWQLKISATPGEEIIGLVAACNQSVSSMATVW